MSTTDNSALLIGVFYDREHAERAFRELQHEGFGDGQLSVALMDANEAPPTLAVPKRRTQARAGTAIGAVLGVFVGGLLGLLVIVWWPILGPLSTLVLSLATSVAAGISLGGLGGALIGCALRSEEEELAPERPQPSRGIVTVRPNSRYDEAAAILRRHAGCDADPASARETAR